MALEDVTRLDARNYAGCGTTRLYDAWCSALAANVTYAQTLRDSGTPCGSIVVVVTDGEEVGSTRRAADCKRMTEALLASEPFTLAFVGVGSAVDFHGVAREMGIPDGCVAVQSQTTPTAIRAVFRMVSQLAIRASQGLVRPGVNGGFFAP